MRNPITVKIFASKMEAEFKQRSYVYANPEIEFNKGFYALFLQTAKGKRYLHTNGKFLPHIGIRRA